MIKKFVKKSDLGGDSPEETDLAYWLTKTPQERIEAVEILRRQCDGSTARLQRVVKVVQRAQR